MSELPLRPLTPFWGASMISYAAVFALGYAVANISNHLWAQQTVVSAIKSPTRAPVTPSNATVIAHVEIVESKDADEEEDPGVLSNDHSASPQQPEQEEPADSFVDRPASDLPTDWAEDDDWGRTIQLRARGNAPSSVSRDEPVSVSSFNLC